MTPELLRRVGEALYGPFWQSELALALHVSVRSVRRWLTGEHEINSGVMTDLAALCEKDGRELLEISTLLRAQAAEQEAEEKTAIREDSDIRNNPGHECQRTPDPEPQE